MIKVVGITKLNVNSFDLVLLHFGLSQLHMKVQELGMTTV